LCLRRLSFPSFVRFRGAFALAMGLTISIATKPRKYPFLYLLLPQYSIEY